MFPSLSPTSHAHFCSVVTLNNVPQFRFNFLSHSIYHSLKYSWPLNVGLTTKVHLYADFFKSQYDITTWSAVGWIHKCETWDMEESQRYRGTTNIEGQLQIYKLYVDFFFFFFRVAPMAYGNSQATGQIRAVAAGLCPSHSNEGSEWHLQPTSQLVAIPDPWPTERGQGSYL